MCLLITTEHIEQIIVKVFGPSDDEPNDDDDDVLLIVVNDVTT